MHRYVHARMHVYMYARMCVYIYSQLMSSLGLEVPGNASMTSSINSMYSRSKTSTIVGNTCTSRSNSVSSFLTSTCTGATSSSGSSSTIVPLGRQTEKTSLSVSGKSASRSLQLQYCDICKISCAGSQVFVRLLVNFLYILIVFICSFCS